MQFLPRLAPRAVVGVTRSGQATGVPVMLTRSAGACDQTLTGSQRSGSAISAMNLTFNWAYVLSFAAFWVYGYYGAISSRKYPILSLAFTGVSLVTFISFILMARKTDYFNDKVHLRYRDGAVLLVYLAVLFGVSLTYLVNDITLDQLYHAQAAHLQTITLIDRLSEKLAPMRVMVFSRLLWLLNLVVIILLLGVCYLLKKRTVMSVVVLSMTFLLARSFVYYTFEGTDPHPQLRLLPLWVTSLLLGINNVSLRSTSLVALAALMWVVWRTASGKISWSNAALLGMAAGTIPVVFHAGTIVEPSIWGSLLFTGLVLSFHEYSSESEINWTGWFSVATVFYLLRQTVVAALILLLVLFIDDVVRRKAVRFRDIAVALSPLIVMIFVFIKSLYWGTPGSTMGSGVADSAPQRVLMSIVSGALLEIMVKHFHWSLMGFFLLGFIPLRRAAIKGSLLMLFFFAVLYFMFYTAAPSAWGTGRYQAEYVAPFIVLGLFKFALLASRVQQGNYLVGLVLILLIINNCYIYVNLPRLFWNLPEYSRPVTITYPAIRRMEAIVSTEVNNYSDMLRVLKKDGFAQRTMLVDAWTYGAFPHILSGYSVGEVRFASAKFHEHCTTIGGRCSSASVIQDKDIDTVIVDKRNGQALSDFAKANWRRVPYEYSDRRFSNYAILAR